ncbi:hypothetical protein LCGC14_0839950 [marine sediment metagenome]|uniref:High potential iron-sulfur proteins family profile domain-containing protein n=1 Tax=marine sediment metagenome TaxID=412755 RepID=A0A0F9PYM3_9ZZZZ
MVQSLLNVAVIGVTALVVLTIAEKALQNKAAKGEPIRQVSKRKAQYQTKPKGRQACYNCQFYSANDRTCDIVKGDIAPDAWSKFYLKEKRS